MASGPAGERVERVAHLIDEAAQRSQVTLRDRVERLWAALPALGQTALAAAGAWLVATELVGHHQPFFAPIAAIVALGITYGQRARRAVEICFGVALGILVADLILIALGTGAAQIALVVALAMAVAIMLGGRPLVISQAATSASLVATVSVPDHVTFARFVDALVGGAVALLVSFVLFPVNAVRMAARAAEPLLTELAAVLRDIAQALADADLAAAEDALDRARGLDRRWERFSEATAVGGELGALSPLRRRDRATLDRYATASQHLEHAVRNARVLARGAVRATDLDANVPPETVAALRNLAAAVRALTPSLDDPARADRAREHALKAAGEATLGLERTANLSTSVIVGQVRSMSTDLLRGLGVEGHDATDAVRAAAREAAAAELARDD